MEYWIYKAQLGLQTSIFSMLKFHPNSIWM